MIVINLYIHFMHAYTHTDNHHIKAIHQQSAPPSVLREAPKPPLHRGTNRTTAKPISPPVPHASRPESKSESSLDNGM